MTRRSLCLLPLLAAPMFAQAAGEIDPTFRPVAGITVEVAALPDRKVLGLGDYTGDPDGSGGALVRFLGDGGVDPGFAAPFTDFSGSLRHFTRQSDGRIIVGGGIFAGQKPNQLVTRLLPGGALDPGFNLVDKLSQPSDFVVQRDGKVILNSAVSGDPSFQSVFTRVNADGSVDRTFDLPDSLVSSVSTDLALQADGRLVTIGNFAEFSSTGFASFSTARFTGAGAFDPGFQRAAAAAPTEGITDTLALQADGKLLVSGGTYSPFPTIVASLRRYAADGSLDRGFSPTFAPAPGASIQNTSVQAILVQGNGKIVVGGMFGSVNGVPRTNIARLNADGTLDAAFVSPPEFASGGLLQVIDIKEASDGKLLVGGELYRVESPDGFSTLYGLVRLLNDGGGTTNPPPAAKGPDLQGALSGVKLKAVAGKVKIKAKLTVRNAGAKKAKGITAAAYLSADGVFDLAADTFLRSIDLGAAGKLGKQQTSGPIPLTFKLADGGEAAGKYLLVVLDPTGAIEETDETNNTAAGGPLP